MNDDMTLDAAFESALRRTLHDLAPVGVPTSLEGIGRRVPRSQPRLVGGLVFRRGGVLSDFGVAAVVLVLASLTAWSVFDRPTSSVGAPASRFISAFVDQTDGAYGYRMLRPSNWTPQSSDVTGGRLYEEPGANALLHGLAFNVVNLATTPTAQQGNSTWTEWLASPTLDGWTAAAEQEFGQGNSTVTPLRTLPNARIFAADYHDLAYMVVIGLVVDKGQPLFLQLAAAGSEKSLKVLEQQQVVDDFATMVGSVQAIPADPANVHPPLPGAATPPPLPEDTIPSSSPSVRATMSVSCAMLTLELCNQAVTVAIAYLPPGHPDVVTVALRATETLSICPPSQSFVASNPGTCRVIADVTTADGTVSEILRLTSTGWQFETTQGGTGVTEGAIIDGWLIGHDSCVSSDPLRSCSTMMSLAMTGFDARNPGHLPVVASELRLEGNPVHSSLRWVALFKLSDGTLRAIGVWYPGVSVTPQVIDYGP
jgi:hypothetical protein